MAHPDRISQGEVIAGAFISENGFTGKSITVTEDFDLGPDNTLSYNATSGLLTIAAPTHFTNAVFNTMTVNVHPDNEDTIEAVDFINCILTYESLSTNRGPSFPDRDDIVDYVTAQYGAPALGQGFLFSVINADETYELSFQNGTNTTIVGSGIVASVSSALFHVRIAGDDVYAYRMA